MKQLPRLHIKSMVKSPDKARKTSGLAGVYHHLGRSWYRSQIGHRSQYSVERLLAFRDYYQRTSLTRVIAVCLLTPIPALLATYLIDCIPLRAPSAGWKDNYTLWVRLFLEAFAVAMGLISQVREVIVSGTISHLGAVTIAAGTGVCYVSVAIVVAASWHFPVPFGFVISVAPVVSFFCFFTVVIVGPRRLLMSTVLRQQIKSQLVIVATQGLVGVVFPVFSAVFNRLSRAEQNAFVLVMPLIKYVTKQIIGNAAKSLHEYVGPIVVFSVDVFYVFYVAICMQTSKSTITTLLMVGVDSFHVIASLRTIFHLVSVVKQRRGGTETATAVNYMRDLPAMVRNVYAGPAISQPRIRVFAPFPLTLSNESLALMSEISGSRRVSHVYSSSRVPMSRSSRLASVLKIQDSHHLDERSTQETDTAQRSIASIVVSKMHQVTPANLALNHQSHPHGANAPHNESFMKRLAGLVHVNTATTSDIAVRTAKDQIGAEEAVWDTLRAFFHSEYLLMAEYVECVLPMLYAVYLSLLYNLPVAPYYPHTASLTPEKLAATVTNIAIFVAVEVSAFLLLLIVLRRKFGISPIYQLAFVLETQAHTLQGHLFVWTIYILHLPLVHYGVDFNAFR